MKKFFAFLAGCLSLLAAAAQSRDSLFIRRLADEILVNSKAYDNLRTLTKNIGARLSGSPQMVKAEQWGLQAMQAAGGDARMQACLVPHWVRGGTDRAVANLSAKKSAPRKLDVIALGNSMGTGGRALTAPVMEVAGFDELEARKDEVKGKIVFYNYKFNPTFVKTFQSYSDAVTYRGQGASRAAKYGAVAVIVRSMSHGTDNHPHTGSLRYDSAYALIPAFAVGLQDADWLSASKAGVASLTLTSNGHFLPDTVGHNIIGEMRGSEFPNEYITIGGHLDSWDPGEGAHDDGAGCVQTIEVLRALRALGYQPRHTLRFVLFANEENGLRGGTKYADEAKAKGEKHILALESDEGGFTPRGIGFTGSEAQFAKISAWSALLEPYGGAVMRGGGGSDIGPLSRTQQTPLASLIPDSQRYFDVHHARSDVFEAVNKRELELGAVNIAAFIFLVDKYGL